MDDNNRCRPPGYSQQSSAVVGGTSWTKLVGPNPNRQAIIFGRGNLGGQMALAGPGGTGLQITLNNENPNQRVDLDGFGDLCQQGWYVNTFGSPLTITWTEILCWPC